MCSIRVFYYTRTDQGQFTFTSAQPQGQSPVCGHLWVDLPHPLIILSSEHLLEGTTGEHPTPTHHIFLYIGNVGVTDNIEL